MRLSHNSYASSKDENGLTHFFSIDPWSVRRGAGTSSYQARARSDGGLGDPKDRSIMTVTFTDNAHLDTAEWAGNQVQKRDLVDDLAQRFNLAWPHVDRDGGGNKNISFLGVQTAELENVSSFQLPGTKRRKNETFVATRTLSQSTTFLQARDSDSDQNPKGKSYRRNRSQSVQGPNGSSRDVRGSHPPPLGRTRTISEPIHNHHHHDNHRHSHHQHDALQAFVHYTFCYHDGTLALDQLEGEYDSDSGYSLTTPTLHSWDGRFGQDDEGTAGIRRVIQNHRCTGLCRHLPPMTLTLTFTSARPCCDCTWYG